MKKLILALAIVTASLVSFGQNMPTLYFKINAPVITTDGRTISSGAVVSFIVHDNAISNGVMPCDLKWWVSEAAQDSGYATIMPTTALFNGTLLNVASLVVTVTPHQFTYQVYQSWAEAWLKNIYGSSKVVILN